MNLCRLMVQLVSLKDLLIQLFLHDDALGWQTILHLLSLKELHCHVLILLAATIRVWQSEETGALAPTADRRACDFGVRREVLAVVGVGAVGPATTGASAAVGVEREGATDGADESFGGYAGEDGTEGGETG